MIRRLSLLAVLLALAVVAQGEVGFTRLSVTATSQYYTFAPSASSVLLCNYGTNEVYYRLYNDLDTPAVATTSYAQLVAGAATAPVCKSFSRTDTNPAYFRTLAIVCAGGETATVEVEFE